MNLSVQDVIVRPIISEKAERGREARVPTAVVCFEPQPNWTRLPWVSRR